MIQSNPNAELEQPDDQLSTAKPAAPKPAMPLGGVPQPPPIPNPTAGQTTPPAVTPQAGDATAGQGKVASTQTTDPLAFAPMPGAPNVGVQVASPMPLGLAGTPTAGQTTPPSVISRGGDATTGQGMNPAAPTSVPAPTPAAATPSDPTGHNRAYLGADRDTGQPVWGDDGVMDQSIRYDAQGNPQWNAALTGYNKQDYDQRALIAKMSPAELQAFVSSHAGSDPASQRARDYAQGLITAQQYDPDAVRALTSDEAIYGKPLTDQDYLKRHRVGDPTFHPPTDAQLRAGQGGSAYSTIQGGQEFTNADEGQAAFDAIQAQMKAGGGALFNAAQPGGTIRSDAAAQLGRLAGSPASSEGGRGGAGPTPGRPPLGGGGAPPAGGGPPGTPPGTSPLPPGQTVPSGGVNRGPAYSADDINPDDALYGKVITPGAGVDRYRQAEEALANYRKGTESGFKADSDTIAANSFGAGRGVSGQNRTRQGNLALARENDLNTKGFDFLNSALTGSIDDSYKDIGIAQQQQGYQKGLNDTAFDQERDRALLEDALTNSDFGRHLSQQTAGYANSPEQYDLILSKIFGDQSSAAGKAAADSFRNAGGGSNGGGSGGNGSSAFDLFGSIYDAWKKRNGNSSPPGGYVDSPIEDDGTRVA